MRKWRSRSGSHPLSPRHHPELAGWGKKERAAHAEAPSPPELCWPQAQETKVIIILRTPKDTHTLRPALEHKSHQALGYWGEKGDRSGQARGMGDPARRTPEEPPPIFTSALMSPLLSSPPFPHRPREQSRCHDTAGRWAALAAVWSQPPRSEPRWEGSGCSAPAPSPDERNWQEAPLHLRTCKGAPALASWE